MTPERRVTGKLWAEGSTLAVLVDLLAAPLRLVLEKLLQDAWLVIKQGAVEETHTELTEPNLLGTRLPAAVVLPSTPG